MYIEYVFLISVLLSYFTISLALKALNEKSSLKPVCVIFTSIVWSLVIIWAIKITNMLVIFGLTFVVNVLICFKVEKIKNFFVSFVIYLLSNFLFFGTVFLAKQMWNLSDIFVIVLTAGLYIVLSFVCSVLNKKRIVKNFLLEVTIIDGENCTTEDAYYDSGNLLYDPITHDPICLISTKAFANLYELDPLSIFLKSYDVSKLKNNHYIQINSVTNKGKILVFNVDQVVVHGQGQDIVFENACVGLSMTEFEKAMKSSVLLHSSQLI